tara:strand:- start:1064 stop:1249 length:186 start_codon:yes stop_codon:yes gene_type:complete
MSDFFAALFTISMAASAMVVAVGLAVGVWVLIFTAIDKEMAKHAIEYQECGGVYCPQDETK